MFGKWKFFEDNERCKIWSETTHVGGRYLGSVAPVVEFYRNKASKGASLGFLLVGAAVLIPLILGYTAWSYWVFRGKVGTTGGYH